MKKNSPELLLELDQKPESAKSTHSHQGLLREDRETNSIEPYFSLFFKVKTAELELVS